MKRKNGKNFFFVKSIENEIFEEEPLKCNEIKWNKINNNRINGRRKWKEKNVITSKGPTLTSLQRNRRIFFPKIGSTNKNCIITVAAQYDIWPQGST